MKCLTLLAMLLLAGRPVFASDLRLAETLTQSSAPTLNDDGPLREPRHIQFGMTPANVVAAMHGEPDVQLAPDVWVYWQFRSGVVGAEKFDTLIVRFVEGRVRQYRLVERKAVQALMRTLQPAAPAGRDVAKK